LVISLIMLISSVYILFFNCQMELASDNHASV